MLVTSLWLTVNQTGGPYSLELKYLEKVHTYMRPDSMHGSIGNKLKKTTEVQTWQDLQNINQASSSKIKVITINHTDIFQFKDFHSKTADLPLLKNIKAIKFVNGSNMLYYKQSHDEKTYHQAEFLQQKYYNSQADDYFPKTKTTPRGINLQKKKGIINNLISHMPNRKQQFWINIPTSTSSPDLSKERDAAEQY